MSKFKIVEKDGDDHLVEEGFFSDEDHGKIHETSSGKLETRNIFGKNFELEDKSGIFSSNEKFNVKTSDGESGVMEKDNSLFADKDSYNYTTDKGGKEDKGGCFITTACIRAKGLPDNCTELNTLRAFRDQYIKNLTTGEQIIAEYYSIAPQIVSAINQDKYSQKIYQHLFKKLVLKSLHFIRSGENDKAFMLYLEIVNRLKKRYLVDFSG